MANFYTLNPYHKLGTLYKSKMFFQLMEGFGKGNGKYYYLGVIGPSESNTCIGETNGVVDNRLNVAKCVATFIKDSQKAIYKPRLFNKKAPTGPNKIKAAVFEVLTVAKKMTTEGNFVQPTIPCFDVERGCQSYNKATVECYKCHKLGHF
ncbi:hypothetical protein CsSME_00038118 [Camellia sinensis var. sinensis]